MKGEEENKAENKAAESADRRGADVKTGDELRKKLDGIAGLFHKGHNRLYKLALILLVGVCLIVIAWPTADEDDSSGAGSAQGTSPGSSLWSSGTDSDPEEGTAASDDAAASAAEVSVTDSAKYAEYMEEKLTGILSGMEGVSQVSVMITVKDSGESVTIKDVNTGNSESDGSSQSTVTEETVMRESGDVSEPYVTQYVEPEIEGVVVCCKGAENAELSLKITNAVQALFDVPAHKIVVLEAN